MADSIAWTRSTIAEAMPSSSAVKGKLDTASGELDKLLPAMPTISAFQPPPRAAAMAAAKLGAGFDVRQIATPRPARRSAAPQAPTRASKRRLPSAGRASKC
jgi:hypothetical protein